MKQALLQLSSRMRFVMAMLAMTSAMWAAIYLHQHEDGLHQLGQCVACSLEKSVSHGFTPTAVTHLAVQWGTVAPVTLQEKVTIPACRYSVSIRAPPFA